MRKFFILLIFMLSCVISNAQKRETEFKESYQLTIFLKNGNKAIISLYNEPTLLFDDDEVTVTYNSLTFTYKNDEVDYFDFDEDATGIVIPNEELDTQFRITENELVITSLKPGAKVNVYSSNGVLVGQQNEDGGVSAINISNLPSGIYIVKSGSLTYKFLKR